MSLTILCPNGRRQTMKVKPNTSILEILEFVCEKLNIDPKEYELSRNNKALDLSLTVRFANIPNNGQLDLKKSDVIRKDQKVTVAIDLEDGMRKISEFESNQSLWDIIHSLFENNPILSLDPNKQFSLIYVQKEISGEKELKETNLKSLGLIQGRAAMKLLVRPITAVKEQAFVESLDLRKFNQELQESQIKTKNEISEKETKPVQTNTIIESKTKLDSTQQTQSNSLQISSKETIESNTDVMKSQPSIKETKDDSKESEDIQKIEISSDESEDEGQEILNYLGGNHSEILFKTSDLPKVSKKDFSDDFYETTKDDLMHVINSLRRQQTEENHLETNQMREQKRRERIKKYKSTVIRVCFPNDKLVFQAIFKPTDTVEDVKKVIRNYVTSEDFYLYTVPPKCVLKAESNLFESNLVPAALIHLGLKSDNNQNVIKDEFKSKVSSYKSAAKVAAQARDQNKTVVSNINSGNSSQPSAERRPNERQDHNSGEKESKVPKWFKTNK